MLVIKLALIILLFIPFPVFAWGPLGHKAICDAVWRASEPQVQDELVAVAKRMGYKTFAESCLWADSIRGQRRYAWTKPLHYMNLSRQAKEVATASCFNDKHKPTCVRSAIDYYQKRILNESLSRRQRDEALLFLSHFVGDLHQPLHVAYRDDRGGTRQNVVFEGKLMSLHSLWDGDILYCGTRARWRDLGKQLYRRHSHYKADQVKQVTHWVQESFALTRLIYANLNERLPKAYCDQYHPLAMIRLELASLRLATLLNLEQSTARQTDAATSGETAADKVQSAPNLINRLFSALWKLILTLVP